MRRYKLRIRPFSKTVYDKEQALKPLEFAANIYEAWQGLILYDAFVHGTEARRAQLRGYVIHDCMNAIQAAVNILAALNIEQDEIDTAIDQMDARNDRCGRF